MLSSPLKLITTTSSTRRDHNRRLRRHTLNGKAAEQQLVDAIEFDEEDLVHVKNGSQYV
jgi:hypothetical protein